MQKRRESPLEDVATSFIGFAAKSYRVRHVRRTRFKLAQEISLLRGFGKEQFDQALVIACHHEDMRGFSDELFREGLAAKVGQINAVHREGLNRMAAGGHAAAGAYTRRLDADVIASGQEPPKEPLGHRATADVARANEKNILHAFVVNDS